MFLIASQIVICLLLATFLGFIIGYFFFKLCKNNYCNNKKSINTFINKDHVSVFDEKDVKFNDEKIV